jgi:TPR repeat protein
MSSRELKSKILSLYEKKYPGTTLVGTPLIKDDAVANVFDVSAQFKVPAPLVHKDGRYVLEYDSKIIGDSLGVPGKLVRNYPFAVHDGNSRSRYHLRIDWPRTFRTDSPSTSKSLESPFFEAHERYSSLGNELDYQLDYNVKVDVVKPEDMAALQGKAKLLREFDEASFRVNEAQISSAEFAAFPMADLDSLRVMNEAVVVERKMQEKRFEEVGLLGLCDYLVARLETYDLLGQDRAVVLRKYRPLLELGRKNDELDLCMARVAYTRGMFDDAVLYFDKAQMPDKSAEMLKLAWARFYAGDVDGAKAVLVRFEAAQGASAGDGRNDSVTVDKLALYQRLGMSLPADLQHQAGLMPDGPWPGPLLALQAGLIDQDALTRTMASYPEDARSLAEDMAWFYIGQKALAEQDTARAKSAFEWYRSDFNRATGFVNRVRIELARLRPADAEFEAGKEDDEMGDRVAALQRWGMAGHKGSALSQDQMAQEYYYGRNLLDTDGTAFEWAQKAANQGVARAQNLLGVLYDHGNGVAADKQAAINWFRKAAAQGQPDGQYNLAMKLRTGEGVAQDLQESERLLLASASQGYRDSEIQLARDYLFGFYGRKDFAAVAIWSRRAALQDSNLARVMLARAYLEGKGLDKSPAVGVRIMRQAAQLGDVDANKWMGILYDTGNGVGKNHQMAVQWYETAIKFGSAEAKSLLLFGVPAQDPGNPEPVDFQKVFSDTVSAAGAQDAAALYRLGFMYKLGIGTAKDQKLATSSFEKAAGLGNVDAQVEMAMLYDSGTDRNASRAMAWFEKASNQGSGFAAKNWADMYVNGQDVRQDYGRAFELYARAVKLGYGFAGANIGSMYQNGWGVKRDPVLAYTYFSIVAREDESAVAVTRSDLRQEIGAEKAAQADKVAEAWTRDMPLPGEAKK